VSTAATESESWPRDLRSGGAAGERAAAQVHQLLVRVAARAANRRRSSIPDGLHDELDDLVHQAASDALMAITRKLDSFRGEARFTTWASKFAIFELSSGLRRRIWRDRPLVSDDSIVGGLADSAPSALATMERSELMAGLARAMATELTDRQRLVFQSAAVDEVPIDVLAERLGSSRGAIYKLLHDARRRLRTSLVRQGYQEASGR
jgi:RNA polymerase sigma-70 factor, ECF subfamily